MHDHVKPLRVVGCRVSSNVCIRALGGWGAGCPQMSASELRFMTKAKRLADPVCTYSAYVSACELTLTDASHQWPTHLGPGHTRGGTHLLQGLCGACTVTLSDPEGSRKEA